MLEGEQVITLILASAALGIVFWIAAGRAWDWIAAEASELFDECDRLDPRLSELEGQLRNPAGNAGNSGARVPAFYQSAFVDSIANRPRGENTGAVLDVRQSVPSENSLHGKQGTSR